MAKAKASAEVHRGPESWNYIYIFLGFALSIEGTLIGFLNLGAIENFPLCPYRCAHLVCVPSRRVVSKQADRLESLIRGQVAESFLF
jgi:hypothetical protein